jgi:SAM-dependent methyltransferase
MILSRLNLVGNHGGYGVFRNYIKKLEIEPIANIDGSERLETHAKILRRKHLLRNVFQECHKTFLALDKKFFSHSAGLRIELGAGVSPVRETFPEVLATDIVPAPHFDRVINAQEMDLADGSVHALYCQNSFHHFPQPEKFFKEAIRVLRPGGGIILIEPYHGFLSSLLYPSLFASEHYDKRAASWSLAANNNPMSDANQALSYLVFTRDLARFSTLFPELEIVHRKPLTNYVRYLLSGGLNFHQLAPNWMERPLKVFEFLLTPIATFFALHHVIVIRKKSHV